MATIQIRVDDTIKMAADSLFGSLGLDTATAVRMFIAAALDNCGLPFSVRKNKAVELGDGYGSYLCEYGHLHDYKTFSAKMAEAEKETVGPFGSVEEMMRSLNDD